MTSIKSKECACPPRQLLMQLDHTLGHIRGKIVDIDGYAISGARVWLRETGQDAYADAEGNFIVINITPGLYTLIVECEGYSLCVSPDVPVEVGDNPGLRFVMHSFPVPQRLYSQIFQSKGIARLRPSLRATGN